MNKLILMILIKHSHPKYLFKPNQAGLLIRISEWNDDLNI